MIQLRVLGATDLRNGDGWEVRSILAQPKRLALLAYLACARPGAFHRRERLIALFWPDLDPEHGRMALRQAVYQLRHALGARAIVGRGDDELATSGEVWCDAAAFQALVAQRRMREAVDLYRGPLLEGLVLPGLPAFERWVEAERQQLTEAAARVAVELSESVLALGQPDEAIAVARTALDLAPYSEVAARQLMRACHSAGDSAAALAAFRAFSARLHEDLQLEPCALTIVLAEEIRLALPRQTPLPAGGAGEGGGGGWLPLGLAAEDSLDGLPLSAAASSRAWERFLHAEVLRAQGRTEEAMHWYGAVPETCGPALVAVVHYRQAEAWTALGRADRASAHWRRFLEVWETITTRMAAVTAEVHTRVTGLRPCAEHRPRSQPEPPATSAISD